VADQKLSPPGSPAKIEVRAKAGSGKRAALYTRVSTGERHPETQLYDLCELAKQRRYEIVHEYTGTISGKIETSRSRPASFRCPQASLRCCSGRRFRPGLRWIASQRSGSGIASATRPSLAIPQWCTRIVAPVGYRASRVPLRSGIRCHPHNRLYRSHAKIRAETLQGCDGLNCRALSCPAL
jgi:hypothetical protein